MNPGGGILNPSRASLSLSFLSFRPKETALSLSSLVVVQKSSFLNERRGLDETTKKNQQVSYQSAIHEERKRDSSSSIEPFKDEKKIEMNWSQTHNFNVRPPFSVCSAIDVDPSVAMGIGTSADGSSSLSLLAAVRKSTS